MELNLDFTPVSMRHNHRRVRIDVAAALPLGFEEERQEVAEETSHLRDDPNEAVLLLIRLMDYVDQVSSPGLKLGLFGLVQEDLEVAATGTVTT